jgi:hypothetical protein
MVISRPRPIKAEEFRVGGLVKEIDREKKQWFTFEIQQKPRDIRRGLRELTPRIQKVENKDCNYFRMPPFQELVIRVIYLTSESEEGLYKNPENNLPYEIHSISGDLLYRQSIVETKKDISKRLERIAVEEGIKE